MSGMMDVVNKNPSMGAKQSSTSDPSYQYWKAHTETGVDLKTWEKSYVPSTGTGTIGNEPKPSTGTPITTGTGTGTTGTTTTTTATSMAPGPIVTSSASEFVLGSKYYDIPIGTTIEERQTTYDISGSSFGEIGKGSKLTRKEYFRKDTGERLKDVEYSGSGGSKSYVGPEFQITDNAVEDVFIPEVKPGENAFSPDKVEPFSVQEIAKRQAMGTRQTGFRGQDIVQHPKTTMQGGKYLPYSKEYREITESVSQAQARQAYETTAPAIKVIETGFVTAIVAVPTLGLLPVVAGPAVFGGSILSSVLEFDIAARTTPPMDIINAPEFGGAIVGSIAGGYGVGKLMPKPTVTYRGYQNVVYKHGAPENILTESGAAAGRMTRAEGVVIETGRAGRSKITSVARFSGESVEIKPPIIERPLPRAGTSATSASGITIVSTPRAFRSPKVEVMKTNVQEDIRIHPSIIESEESKLFLSSRHIEGKDTVGVTAQLSNVPKEDMTFSVSKAISRESFKKADVGKVITGEAFGRLDTGKAMELPKFGGETPLRMFRPYRPSKPSGPADAQPPFIMELPKSEPHAFSGPGTVLPSIPPSKIISNLAPQQTFLPAAVMLHNPLAGSRFDSMGEVFKRQRKDIWSGQGNGLEELERQKKGVGEAGASETGLGAMGRVKAKSPFIVPITGMAQATAQRQRMKTVTAVPIMTTFAPSPPMRTPKIKIHIPDFPDMKLGFKFGSGRGGVGRQTTTYKPSAVANVFDIRGSVPKTITGLEFARPKKGRKRK